jgi:hypothetical protein
MGGIITNIAAKFNTKSQLEDVNKKKKKKRKFF